MDKESARLTLYLDYVAGEDLNKTVDRSGLSHISEPVRYTIWKDISHALEFVHRHGIVHHDVKPSNILYDSSRNMAVLCDFGLATFGPRLHYGGTPAYVSPNLLHKDDRSAPDDIWAFGVTMLFVLGLIPLPQQNWIIADLKERRPETVSAMVAWQLEIRRTCLRVPQPFDLVRSMLKESKAERITAPLLVSHFSRAASLNTVRGG